MNKAAANLRERNEMEFGGSWEGKGREGKGVRETGVK